MRLTDAIAAVRATLFDLRNSGDSKFKLGASEIEVQQEMAAKRRPTLLQADFEAAIASLESMGQVDAVEGSRGTCYALTLDGYSQEENARLPWWRRQTGGELLEATAKGLGLFAVLLPISGVLLRWFAFTFGTHIDADTLPLAWSASPSQLIATGFAGFILPALTYAVISLVMFWDLRRGQDQRGIRGRLMPQIWRIPSPIMGLLVLAILLGIVASPPTTLLTVVAGAALGLIGARLTKQAAPLRLAHLWPIVVISVLSSGIVSGLNGNLAGVQPGNYIFASSTVANGKYAEVGNFDNLVYLTAYHQPASVVAVSASQILAVRLAERASSPRPSIFDMVVRHKPPVIGFKPPC